HAGAVVVDPVPVGPDHHGLVEPGPRARRSTVRRRDRRAGVRPEGTRHDTAGVVLDVVVTQGRGNGRDVRVAGGGDHAHAVVVDVVVPQDHASDIGGCRGRYDVDGRLEPVDLVAVQVHPGGVDDLHADQRRLSARADAVYVKPPERDLVGGGRTDD